MGDDRTELYMIGLAALLTLMAVFLVVIAMWV